jgi:hypothetical protein
LGLAAPATRPAAAAAATADELQLQVGRQAREIAALRAQLAAQPPAARAAAGRRKGAVKETEALPNGTEVLRFDAGREIVAGARGMPAHAARENPDDPRLGGARRPIHEITVVTETPRDEIDEMLRQIRADRFREVLGPAMRRHGVDMLVYVMRLGRDTVPSYDNQFAEEFGAGCGVFVFADRGEGRGLESAVFDHTDRPVESLGVYDKVFKPSQRMTMSELGHLYGDGFSEENGSGRGTELDWRFEGLGDYVRARRPRVIGLNFWEDLGGAVEYEPGVRDDGVSLTDHRLLVRELGAEYAGRIVSAEHLLFDYISRPVAKEIELCTLIRADCERNISSACAGAVSYGLCWHLEIAYYILCGESLMKYTERRLDDSTHTARG